MALPKPRVEREAVGRLSSGAGLSTI